MLQIYFAASILEHLSRSVCQLSAGATRSLVDFKEFLETKHNNCLIHIRILQYYNII